MSSLAISNPGSQKSQATNSEYNSDNQPDSLLMGRVLEELILKILGFLSPEELARTSRVCRKWNRLGSDPSVWIAFDLKKLFPSLKVLNETTWKTHADLIALGLSVDDAPPLDNHKMILELKRLFSSLKAEKNAGVTLLTIPKGLSFKKLKTFAESPKQGNPTCFRPIYSPIEQKLGEISVDKTYRVAITNSVLEGSRNLTVSAQKKLLEEKGYEIPEVLSVATLAMLTYMTSPESSTVRLYSDNPWTYTRCSEQIKGYNLVVGGFSPGGLYVHSYSFKNDSFGVGALRKV